MKIEEYKKQFIDLFKKLQEEHGNPSKVCIVSNDICDDTGCIIESNPICYIDF